jgi:hypothetical protein
MLAHKVPYEMTDERDHVHKVARANGKKSTLSVDVRDSFAAVRKENWGTFSQPTRSKRQNQGAYVHQGNLELINVHVVEKHFMD